MTSPLEDLRRHVKCLQREIAQKDVALHRKNLALDALHFVWCEGGCVEGVHRYEHGDLTEAIVEEAERNTARLRRWLVNHERVQK